MILLPDVQHTFFNATEGGAPNLPQSGIEILKLCEHCIRRGLQIRCCLLNILLCINGTDDCDSADAAAGEFTDIFFGDTSDCDDRDRDGVADCF